MRKSRLLHKILKIDSTDFVESFAIPYCTKLDKPKSTNIYSRLSIFSNVPHCIRLNPDTNVCRISKPASHSTRYPYKFQIPALSVKRSFSPHYQSIKYKTSLPVSVPTSRSATQKSRCQRP